MDSLVQDLRFAFRSLVLNPGFTLIAASCVALGIAANVFVYSPVNAIMIRPLPYRDSGRLMHVNTWRVGEEKQNYSNWSWADYQDIASLATVFTEIGASRGVNWNLGGLEEPERVAGQRVTSSLFPMLGLAPALGRFFRPDEELNGKVVVIGHGLWQRKFGGDSAVVGRAVTVNGAPYTVIGVMAEGVRYPEVEDMWLPLEPSDAFREQRDNRSLTVVGRLAPGVSIAQANARLGAFMGTLAAKYPATNRAMSGWMLRLQEDVAGEVRPIFLTMVGAVLFVLLIACSNVANLLLARGSSRQRELAIRLSMGASRWRLARQLLTESVLLAGLGGILGVVLGTWSVDVFTGRMLPSTVPFWMRFDVDGTVLLWTFGATVVSGLVFGVAPAFQLTRPDLSVALKESGGRGGSAHASVGRVRSALVVTQLAMSLVLLVGGALMVQSFLRSRTAQLGINPANVLTAQFALVGDRYTTDTARMETERILEERVRTIPGVVQVGLAGWVPIGDCCSSRDYYPAGKTYEREEAPVALFNAISPTYFEAFRVPLLSGRNFTSADGIGAPRVAIISESMARREWAGQQAVGQRFRYSSTDSTWVTVVGVVPNVVPRKIGDDIRREHIYVPLAHGPWFGATFVIHTNGDPYGMVGPLRDVMRALDPDLPLARVMSMDDVIRDRMFEGRVYGTMFAIFGAAALLLASIGLYGVMSYVASQRTREMGVRIALGAQSRDVVHLLVGNGARLLAIGVLIGLPASMGLAQLLRGSLYGVTATDPMTFIAIPMVLSAVALLASFVPARRATRVDPIVALRAE
jgi:predicted permease